MLAASGQGNFMRAHHGRRTALSLAVALALTGAPATQAATITVGTPAQCDLAAAIESANGDSSVSGCVAGNGADVVQLPAGTMSPTLPLPPIVSTLEIRGDALGTSAIDCGGGGQPIVIGGELIAGTAAPSVVLRRFGVQNCAYVAGAGQSAVAAVRAWAARCSSTTARSRWTACASAIPVCRVARAAP